MTIKKRIFISNTVIALISLLLLYGIFGGVFEIFRNELMNGPEKQARLSEHTYEMQTLLLEEQNKTESWEALALRAQDYGFAIHVADEDKLCLKKNSGIHTVTKKRDLAKQTQLASQGLFPWNGSPQDSMSCHFSTFFTLSSGVE